MYQQHLRQEETGQHLSLISTFTVWGNYILQLVSTTFTGRRNGPSFVAYIKIYGMREPYIVAGINNIFGTKKTGQHLSLILRFTEWGKHILSLESTTFTGRRNGTTFVAYINIYGMREPYIVAYINNIYGTRTLTVICRLYQHLQYEGTIYCRLYQQHLRHEETDRHLSLIWTFTVWGNHILSIVSTTFTARRNGPSFVAYITIYGMKWTIYCR